MLADKLRRLFDIVERDISHPNERAAAARAGLRLLDAREAELSALPKRPAAMPFNTARRRIAELEAEVITLRVKLGECSPGERDHHIRADRQSGMTYAELKEKWKLGRTRLSETCNPRRAKWR